MGNGNRSHALPLTIIAPIARIDTWCGTSFYSNPPIVQKVSRQLAATCSHSHQAACFLGQHHYVLLLPTSVKAAWAQVGVRLQSGAS